jgi:hypothetical protein
MSVPAKYPAFNVWTEHTKIWARRFRIPYRMALSDPKNRHSYTLFKTNVYIPQTMQALLNHIDQYVNNLTNKLPVHRKAPPPRPTQPLPLGPYSGPEPESPYIGPPVEAPYIGPPIGAPLGPPLGAPRGPPPLPPRRPPPRPTQPLPLGPYSGPEPNIPHIGAPLDLPPFISNAPMEAMEGPPYLLPPPPKISRGGPPPPSEMIPSPPQAKIGVSRKTLTQRLGDIITLNEDKITDYIRAQLEGIIDRNPKSLTDDEKKFIGRLSKNTKTRPAYKIPLEIMSLL